ncbi:MAG: DUF4124 domain-containing protein [Myxococcaceae bacterium]|jgi:hypothetical protein|nr:DUF4124 domain-containing protein [Myxococcaceae bacterium]
MTSAALLLALAQVYVWTDAKGEAHYTDDRASIPKGVKVRTTDGADVSVVEASKSPRPRRASSREEPEPTDTCAAARVKVERLEGKLAEAKKKAELARLIWNGDCQTVLAQHGEGASATCMAGGRRSRRTRLPPDPSLYTGPIEKDLEQARDVLRRAQVAGCR